MKKFILSLMFVLLIPVVAFSEKTIEPTQSGTEILNLESAFDIALKKNPSLAVAEARVKAAAERLWQARSAYFPSIDAFASVSRVNLSDMDYTTRLAQSKLLDLSAELTDPDDYYSAGISASWIIFNGFERLFSNLSAKYGKKDSLAARDDAHRLLLAAVAEAFYNAQLARENIVVARSDEAFNLRLAEDATVRNKFGTGSLSDILNFEVQVNAARSSVITACQVYDVALVGLAALLGFENAVLPETMGLARLKDEKSVLMKLPDQKEQIAYARTHRPDLVQADCSFRQADALVGKACADFYPDIILTASATGDRVGNDDFRDDDFGNTVALTLNYNIFAGGLTRAKVGEARANRTAAESALKNHHLAVSAEVSKAMSRLRSAKEQLVLQRENARLVNENRELVEREYAAGQTSLVRLNEAQRNLVQAQRRLALARVSLYSAWYNLDVATGRNIE